MTDPTAEQITLLEDIATGAWNMLRAVMAQKNNPAKFQIKTPKNIEERVMGELQAAGWIQTQRQGWMLTGSGTKVWRAEMERRRKAAREAEVGDV